jgi:hypothetical protein
MNIASSPCPKPINWEEHVKSWQASGLPMSRYCQQHDLAVHQFGYYKRKFTSLSTAPIKSNTGFAQVIMSGDKSSQGLTLRLTNGLLIEGVCAHNLPLVRSLIEVLS